MMRMLQRDKHIQFVGRARLWFIISGVLMLISLFSLWQRGVNAGLEFRGGSAIEVESKADDVSVEDIRATMQDTGVENVTVQKVGTDGFLIQTEHLDPSVQAKVVDAVSEELDVDSADVNVTNVGPKWGAQITSKAVRALIIFLIFVSLYLSVRLEPKMAGAAMIALVHDLVITAGVYSLSGFEVTPSTVIALLTILGYSLYDTVVIFDRVKDRTANLSAAGRVPFSEACNEALNQVLLRSINTSVVSLLPVGSLLFVGSFLLGAQTLQELALALFVGLAAGAYSSVFIATPALALWKEREPRWAQLRARIAARTTDGPSGFVSEPLPSAPVASAAPVVEPSAPAARPRSQQRKKKRKHGR